ncbi:MAG: FxsA family protein [Methylocystis sp.]|nr:FxsA family protein [Methylocystis sp.]
MKRSKFVAFALTAWLITEVVAFVLVVQFLGLLAAIALGVATTVLGLADVKRLFAYLRWRLSQPRAPIKLGGNMLENALEAIGSVLLILPGFASDLVGLALKAPSIRAALANRLRQRRGLKTRQLVIDLPPNEWKSLDHQR